MYDRLWSIWRQIWLWHYLQRQQVAPKATEWKSRRAHCIVCSGEGCVIDRCADRVDACLRWDHRRECRFGSLFSSCSSKVRTAIVLRGLVVRSANSRFAAFASFFPFFIRLSVRYRQVTNIIFIYFPLFHFNSTSAMIEALLNVFCLCELPIILTMITLPAWVFPQNGAVVGQFHFRGDFPTSVYSDSLFAVLCKKQFGL